MFPFPFALVCGLALTQSFTLVQGEAVHRSRDELATRATRNLLHPGDFETSKWGNWRPQRGLEGQGRRGVTQPGYMSAHAGFVTNAFNMLYTDIKVKPGVLYDFSMYANFTNAVACGVSMYYGGFNTLIEAGGIYQQVVEHEWVKLGASFVASENVTSLYFQYGCALGLPPGSAEFDNIELVSNGPKMYTNRTKPTGPNLIVDPNFDSGTLEAYDIVASGNASYTLTTSGYKNASYGLEVIPGDGNNADPSFSMKQVVPTVIGKVYRFSVAYKYDVAVTANCNAYGELQASDLSASRIFTIDSLHNGQNPGTWEVASGTVSPVGVSGSVFMLGATCYSGVQVPFHFSNLELLPLN